MNRFFDYQCEAQAQVEQHIRELREIQLSDIQAKQADSSESKLAAGGTGHATALPDRPAGGRDLSLNPNPQRPHHP